MTPRVLVPLLAALLGGASAQTPQTTPGAYPITIDVAAVTRAGVTPGAGYVLLRDLKSLVTVTRRGDTYVLRGAVHTLTLKAGMRAATLDGRPATLNATPVPTPDTLLFPLAATRLLGCTLTPLSAPAAMRPFQVTCGDAAAVMAAVTFTNRNTAPTPLTPDPDRVR